MNIGIVTTWFERGAAYVSRQYLEAVQSNPDNNVFVYARGGEEYAINQSTWDRNFVRWGKKSKKSFNGATSIKKNDFIQWLKDKKIECVLFNEQNWWLPVLWCKELGLKTGTYVDYYTEETVPFFEIYDFIFCNTKRHYNLFKHISQCYFIPWGTDINLFSVEERKPKDYITFFHSAGMNPVRKGTDSVIKAFLSLPSTDNCKLLIHTQIPLESCLKFVDKTLCDHPNIVIKTETVAAPGLYGLGDVYLYPSILDGLGLTVVEALSCGLPCIVSDNAPMNEFIKDGINGKLVSIEYLYARGDGYFWPQCKISIDSLRDQMSYYIEKKDEISVFQKKARESAVSQYNWKDRYSNICSFLSEANRKPFDSELSEQIKRYEYKRNGKYNIVPYLFYYWKKYKG